MSTVGIQQHDSRFIAYPWLNIDTNINPLFFQVLSPNLTASMTPFEEPKLMPRYTGGGLTTQIGGDRGQRDLYAPIYTMGPNGFATPACNLPYADSRVILQSPPFLLHSLSSSDRQPSQLQHSPRKERLRNWQCWEHGCNGRQFSTSSNLLRHQREKSSTAAKSSCPKCRAKFTRTTARNKHMADKKCKDQ